MRILCCLILVLASFSSAYPAFAQGSDRIGLFIGNANYPDASTPLTTNKDARVLAEEFRRLSFETETKEDVKKDEMQHAIDAFLAKVNKGSVAVLYFGGYGLQVERQNYLVPVSAQIWSESDVKREGISIESIVGEMDRRGAAVKIIIVDAAYRNPFERRFRSVPAGLTALDSPTGTLVIYSTALGRVANGASGENSLLVRELIKELRAPARSAELVFNDTRRGVSRASNNEQIPWVASSLADEFSLSQTQAATRTPAAPPAPAVLPAPPAPSTPAAPSTQTEPPAQTSTPAQTLPPAPARTATPPPPPAQTTTPTNPPPQTTTPAQTAPPSSAAQAASQGPAELRTATPGGPSRSFIGVNYRFSTDADAERVKAGARRGAFVLAAWPSTPAADAGIRADDLIVRINAQDITKTEDLVRITRASPLGEIIRFAVFRNGRDEEIGVRSISVEEAARRGVPSAMTALGKIYLAGDGVPRNYDEARTWLEKAAAAKDASAMVTLGFMYRNAEGVPRDYGQYRQWIEKAVALNYTEAMYTLGQIYSNGTGVTRDPVTARNWLEKAAQRSYAPAMYALGLIYERGNGVPINRGRAIAWYEKAAAAGNEGARRALERLR